MKEAAIKGARLGRVQLCVIDSETKEVLKVRTGRPFDSIAAAKEEIEWYAMNEDVNCRKLRNIRFV